MHHQAKIVINKDYIEREMNRRGIKSINELARQIGISKSMLNLIMRSKRNPGPKVITTMLAYFNVNFEKIFTEVLTKVHDSA